MISRAEANHTGAAVPCREGGFPCAPGTAHATALSASVVAFLGTSPGPVPDVCRAGGVVVCCFRTVQGLLSFADACPGGVAVISPDDVTDPHNLTTWRAACPADWVTVLRLRDATASVRAAIQWLAWWPLPVWVESLHFADYPRGTGGVHPSADYWSTVRDSCRMVRLFAHRLDSARPAIAANLIGVYAAPDGPASLKQLAGLCGLSDRHARRQLRAAGIRSSHLFFSGSRVLRAWRDVVRHEEAWEKVAHRHGFGSARTLRSEWLMTTGTYGPDQQESEPDDAALMSIADRIFAPAICASCDSSTENRRSRGDHSQRFAF